MNRRIILIAAAIILYAGLGFVAYRLFTNLPPVYKGTYFETPKPMPDFTLSSDQGEIHLSDFRGQYVVLYFGYTFCPDVCPTTLSTINNGLNKAGGISDQFQVLFITVDPRRDTVERMGSYARHFNPNFIGLTGTAEQIDQVATEFGIYYAYNDAESQTEYTVDHTTSVMVLNPEGGLQLLWPFEATANDVASDMKNLTRQ